MDLERQCIAVCGHLTLMTGVHATVLDTQEKRFLCPPFRLHCLVDGSSDCLAYSTHLFGAYEAERWGGQYVYYCSSGYNFIAATPSQGVSGLRYALIVGPFTMRSSNEEELTEENDAPGIPVLATKEVHALGELCSILVRGLLIESGPSSGGSEGITGFLEMLYDPNELIETRYPIEAERQLQENIRMGNKELAHKNLNDILIYIYGQSQMDVGKMKPYFHDLLVLMSRAAIAGGAKAEEIFNLTRRDIENLEAIDELDRLNRQLSASLARFMDYVFDYRGIKRQNIIFTLNSYVKEHLADALSLDIVAKEMSFSKSYLSHVVKEELGCSFTDYVNIQRVERSKYLLLNSGRSITDIMTEVGFEDQSYFTRVFRKITGEAPGKYRKLHK